MTEHLLTRICRDLDVLQFDPEIRSVIVTQREAYFSHFGPDVRWYLEERETEGKPALLRGIPVFFSAAESEPYAMVIFEKRGHRSVILHR